MTNQEAIEFLKNMIDREAIGFVCPEREGDVAIWQYHVEALQMAISALQAQEWIPVKERLPEEDHWLGGSGKQFSDEVLISITNREDADAWSDISQTIDGEWGLELPRYCKITAWKPLPEPYREEENE